MEDGRDREGEKGSASASDAALLLVSNPLPMWVYDPDTLRVLEVNEAAVARYGYSREQFLSMTIADLRPSEEVPRLLESVRGRATDYESTGPWLHRSADGRVFPVVVTSRLVDWRGRRAALVAVEPLAETLAGPSGAVDRAPASSPAGAALHVLSEMLARDLPGFVLLVGVEGIDDAVAAAGVAGGYALTAELEARLRTACVPSVVTVHLGNGRFCFVGAEADAEPVGLARSLLASIRGPFSLPGNGDVYLRGSAALRRTVPGERDADRILRDALLTARRAGPRPEIAVFDPDLARSATERFGHRQEILRFLTQGSVEVHFQPIVALSSGETSCYEALLRPQDPEAVGSPAEVVAVAEELGLVDSLGEKVLARAVVALERLDAEESGAGVAVNLSPFELAGDAIVERVARSLDSVAGSPSRLCLELTEGGLVSVAEDYHAYERLVALHDLGVRIAVDDFGTGYSSLSYLTSLPLDVVKIDRAFVSGMARSPADHLLVETIVRLGHALGLEVVAEGVERPDQLRELAQLGVDAAQGFLLSAALPLAQAVRRRSYDLGRLRSAARPPG